MSRYPPSDYRGPPRDRSRSPPRNFPDRRASAASIFDSRPPGPPRTASDAPRGPRTQFDSLRPSSNVGPGAPASTRSGYASLRDAPPLGSADRGRPYREREYDRRDRQPSPRDRSPSRNFKDTREFSPRELDINRARRESRDGPLSAGSTYSDSQPPLPASSSSRGGIVRGRGRGDFAFRGGRGGRDERDSFRRERSPPPRWPTDTSRDSRDPERRDDRRFERREEERRPLEWSDRERERDADRIRRDQPPPRLESRTPSESMAAVNASSQAPQPSHVNPERLAMIERATADVSARRPSMQQEPYLNGRAETTANRYGSRGSSPPTQAPPVPAFTLSFAPPTAASATASQPGTTTQASRSPQEAKLTPLVDIQASQEPPKATEELKLEPPADAPIAPRMPPAAPKAQLVSPPPAAPRAPRAHDADESTAASTRLQPVRSFDNLSAPVSAPVGPAFSRNDSNTSQWAPPTSTSPAPAVPMLVQPVSPNASQPARLAELNPPTGPRASRMSPAQASVSPRPPAASPRSDIARPSGIPRMQTPPPLAPSGPRNQSYSISPKVANSAVPTEPKANRGPPIAPRGLERGPVAAARAPDRLVAPPWAPPSAPRGPTLWNQWRRPGAPAYGDKTIPAKRDVYGEEKGRMDESTLPATSVDNSASTALKPGDHLVKSTETGQQDQRRTNEMELDKQPPRRQSSMMNSHSAARSFFGKPTEGEEEDSAMSDTAQELPSTSSDDESDMENDLALFNAKFERQKRQLEAQLVDLSTRHYRATTPLENVARLARISTRDLERFNEQREHDMDVDRSPIARKHHTFPATRHSSDSGDAPDIITPKDDDDRRVAIRSSDGSSDGARRIRRPTPEPVNLPYLLKDMHLPFNESDLFKESVQRYEDSKADLLDAVKEELHEQAVADADIEETFLFEFRNWRKEYEQLDKIKEDQEKLERQQSYEPKPEVDAPSVPPVNPVYEGRRLHKFSSEYEIEQVLKQSEETARIEQERQDRELRKNQADMEKEARIPDLLTEDEKMRAMFVDTNRYREAETLTEEFSYQPPVDDFTENEQHIFIAAFKETPKKWSEIASLLPGRNYQDCIRHYYANKWDGRFRDHRTKKLKMGGRRGRGGAKGPRGRVGGLMADLARVEDFLSPDNMNEKGRPKRAAAPTTFAEKEAEAKANLLGPSPAKKPGPGGKPEANGENGPEKPGKRQKRAGEKTGRKGNKSTAPLAALAAAPHGSPGSQQLHEMHSKEDLANANLLANFHSGPHNAPHSETHMIYRQEGYMPAIPSLQEEGERPKGSGQAPAGKQGASSYWSVPEQNDFVKYIGHFGRDFGAIAAHMGTKTQTMIKNHYQRQVDGGNRPELEKAAIDADDRRARGEDVGPPPTPTPIQKRKYENPPAPAQRPLAPHGESGEVDDSGPAQRPQPPRQASPQYQPASRFSSSLQTASVPAPRVGPSPLSTSTAAAGASSATSHSRPMQQAYGSRITFLPDTRSDVRSGAQPVPGYRTSQESPKHSQPPQQPNRPTPDAKDQDFIRNLVEQQQRAIMLEQRSQERPEPFTIHRQPAVQRSTSQGSPPSQAQHTFTDRKPILDDRPLSPPRSAFATTTFPRSSIFGAGSNFPPISTTSISPINRRPAFGISPPKREDSRSEAFPPVSAAPPPAAAATPTEPKRSNVLSLLNDPEEPKPPKRDSLPAAPPRTVSPAQQGYPHTTSATPLSGVPAPKREPSFGQTSILHSQFNRGSSFGQLGSMSTPASHSHKHEPSPGSGSSSQPVKHDWAARVLGQTSQPSPPTPTLDRDTRPYQPHRSILGSLGGSINPSPPPLSANAHSRTPSLSASSSQQTREPLREQPRPTLSGPSAVQSLQPNPYANSSQSGFSNPHAAQAQNQSHHTHNSSHSGGPFPTFHHRTTSRDDYTRQEQSRHEQTIGPSQRESDEQELRLRQQREALEAERRREDPYLIQRRQEQERERHQTQSRGPPPPIQPPTFGSGTFGRGGNLDLRSQSRLESELVMAREEQERQRQQLDNDRRRQEEVARQREAEERRRQEDLYRRPNVFGPVAPGAGRR